MMRWMLMVATLCSACGGMPDGASDDEHIGSNEAALSNKDFDVIFSSCSEFAGIGFVPAANARPLVPASYELAGDSISAVVVIRVARCANAVIDGKSAGETSTAQVGVSVTGRDSTAAINNYTLAFVTNQPRLMARFKSAGVDADLSASLSLGLARGVLSAASSSPHTPSFVVRGTATVPTAEPVPFVASWWAEGHHGTIQSRTVFPQIRFGGATTTLTTPRGSVLARLIGGTTLTFAALDSYNTFQTAQLAVRVTK